MGIKVVRIYCDAAGESHFDETEIPTLEAVIRTHATAQFIDEIPLERMKLFEITKERPNADWHPAPKRQFVLHVQGSSEIEVSDGQRKTLGPGDLLYVEDTSGKGHKLWKVDAPNRIIMNLPVAKDWEFPKA